MSRPRLAPATRPRITNAADGPMSDGRGGIASGSP